MRVRAIIRFRDLEAKRIRSPGETFEVSAGRYDKLRRLGLAEKAKGTGKECKEAAE